MSSRKTKPNRGRNIILPIIVLVLLFACSFGLVAYKRTEAPATAASATPVVIVETKLVPVTVVVEVTALPLPTPLPTFTPMPTATELAVQELQLSPVETTDTFNEESAWLIAEPGVILDDTTAWTIPGTKDVWYANVPEGAFTYFSLGQGKITVDNYSLDLPSQEGHNYLVLIRGRIDDGKVDTDRNLTAEITEFVPGHAIWSYMPKGAYVSKGWFLQQMVASTTESFTNCGALGCSHITIVLLDVDSHTEQRFAVEAEDLATWVTK